MKLDLLINAIIVDDAIRCVSENSKHPHKIQYIQAYSTYRI